jgi:hypothetical protein
VLRDLPPLPERMTSQVAVSAQSTTPIKAPSRTALLRSSSLVMDAAGIFQRDSLLRV